MFNREKFLSFYLNQPNYNDAVKCWEAVEQAFKEVLSVCPTCSQPIQNQGVNPLIMAGALATIRIEVGRAYKPIRENLNYSAQGLLRIFPKYFNATLAKQYEFQPEKIANKVYANRMGNGDEASGDGWRHRGAGWIQNTGKNNWETYGFTPENCLDLNVNARFVAKYFKDRGIIEACMAKDFKKVRFLVNGGYNGLDEFLVVIKQFLA